MLRIHKRISNGPCESWTRKGRVPSLLLLTRSGAERRLRMLLENKVAVIYGAGGACTSKS